MRKWWRDHVGFRSAAALERWDRRLAAAIGAAAAIATLGTFVGAVVMLVRLYTRSGPRAVSNPLETIFDSRLMVGAARLAILCLFLYVIVSVLVHVRSGRWLTAVGPVKVTESLRVLRHEATGRRGELRQAIAENERLRASLTEATNEIRTLESVLERVQTELGRTTSSE